MAGPILDGWAINIDGLLISFSDFDIATSASLSTYTFNPLTNPGVSIQIGTMDFGSIDVAHGRYQTGGGTGIGEMSVSILAPGTHTVSFWLDTHLANTDPNNYWSDYGASTAADGTAPPGTSWTIDEPGYGSFAGPDGTSFYQGNAWTVQAPAGQGDNSNHLPLGGPNSPSDVSLLLSSTFTVPADKYGVKFRFNVQYTTGSGTLLDPNGFYLTQKSALVGGTLYFQESAESIPEPSGLVLMLGGGLAIALLKFSRRASARTQ